MSKLFLPSRKILLLIFLYFLLKNLDAGESLAIYSTTSIFRNEIGDVGADQSINASSRSSTGTSFLSKFPLRTLFFASQLFRPTKSEPSNTTPNPIRDDRQDYNYVDPETGVVHADDLSNAFTNIAYGVQTLVGLSSVQITDGLNRLQQLVLVEKMSFLDWTAILALPLLVVIIVFQKTNIGLEIVLQVILALVALLVLFSAAAYSTMQLNQQQPPLLT